MLTTTLEERGMAMNSDEAKELQRALSSMQLEFGSKLATLIEKVDQLTNTAKKVDAVEDIAKDAARSATAANKRLDDLDIKDLRSRLDKAEVRILDQAKKIDALTQRLWAIGIMLVGAIVKIVFDVFAKG